MVLRVEPYLSSAVTGRSSDSSFENRVSNVSNVVQCPFEFFSQVFSYEGSGDYYGTRTVTARTLSSGAPGVESEGSIVEDRRDWDEIRGDTPHPTRGPQSECVWGSFIRSFVFKSRGFMNPWLGSFPGRG